MSETNPTRESLEQSLSALEAQRSVLGDAIEPAISALRAQLDALDFKDRDTEDQRKQITVLFADVQGFTAMSQEMDPEDVAEVMNSLWANIDKVITDHGGRVDKHIGDAVMALFGAPIAREDDPERAVVAALEMQRMIREFVERTDTSSLQMRVGINTGLAMLGTVGSNQEYTAIGHTVNLASRLEGLARPGGVLISQSTLNEVIGLFDIEATEPLEVKGVDHPVTAYRVKKAKPRTFRIGPREVAGIQTRLVGRDDEMRILESVLPDDPNDPPGTVRLVTLLGEPGVGKSRLVYEFFNFLDALPHPTWLFRGRATEASKDLPYSVLRSILSDRFMMADSDPPDEAKEKMETGLCEYLGEEGVHLAPLLGHLIGLDYRQHPSITGLISEPRLIREKAFKGFVDFLRKGGPGTYRVFLIEDIHWSDEESLDFIEFLAEQLTDMPVMILCTARPLIHQVNPEWLDSSPERTVIRLERLGEDATNLLIDDVLQRLDTAPAELRDLIATRSEGNPFYLEELVKMLIDEGVIDASGATWTVQLDTLNRTNVPGTLTGVLQARLDALPRDERRVLQRSSVVGRVFWEEAVDYVASATSTDGKFEQLAPLADSIKQHELAYERDPSAFEFTREFIFKHAILHDVAYESVVRRARRAFHHETAAWLTGAAGTRREEFAGQIAEHYDRAGDIDEAVDWLLRAGDRARHTHAPDAAGRAYRRAIELSAKSSAAAVITARMQAMGGLGEVLTMQAQYGEAIDVYTELRSAGTEAEDWAAVARAEHGIATAETYRGRLREALDSSRAARLAAEQANDRKREAQAMFIEAWSNIRLGSFQDGVNVASEMLSISRELGDSFLLAESLNLQGVIAASTGSYAQATSHFTEAADLYDVAGNEEKLMPILNNLGVIAELRGEYAAAEGKYREALDRALEVSDRDAQLVYSSNLGGALVAQGLAEEGARVLGEVIEMAPGEFSLLSETHRFLAEALLDSDRFDGALAAANKALEVALSTEAHDHIAGAWRILGVVSSRHGDSIRVDAGEVSQEFSAPDLFAKSLEVAESVEADSDRAKAMAVWAIHDARTGDPASSEARWAWAKEIFLDLGATAEIARVEAKLDSVRAQSD